MKIALALIVKGDDKEAEVLDRCLTNVSPYVDGIFITSTHLPGHKPNESVAKVALKHGGVLSNFAWIYDFASARNFNFSQVPKEYDYILWCDADDDFRGLDKLRDTIEANPAVDTFGFWYIYEVNEHKQPVVVHKKTQVVKNNGSVEWAGKLHEDFKENRAVSSKFIEGIERIHMTDEGRVTIAARRNVEVSKKAYDADPLDPRVFWNYGNSLFGVGEYDKAIEIFNTFLDKSGSEEEKYVILLRLADCFRAKGDMRGAVDKLRYAIGMRINFPDAYYQLGQILFNQGKYEDAERYVLRGLMLKPPYHEMIVYNPRDYDFNPMMLLAKTYFQQNRPDLALPMLEGCLKIVPEDKQIKRYIKEMQEAKAEVEKVLEIIKTLQELETKDELAKALKKVPKKYQSHPAICNIRNTHFIKEESSGKDLVIYCGYTTFQWNPELFKTKGFGGSEEAVVNLAKEWAKLGWNVTVYNNCGPDEMKTEGVTYKPFWMWNPRDKQDVTILWRHPKAVDYNINSRVFIDLHDVISEAEFTPERLAKIEKIFVKTEFHRSLFPNIPDEKFIIIPNGMDFGLFGQETYKDQYLLVNTSSPDRSLDVLPKLFKKVKERVPQAKCKWAYGWEVFDSTYETDNEKMAWKERILSDMKEAGIENLGRLTQKDCAKLYLEANILAYPTEFAEIDCITVKKAQACGCLPVTTDFGALNESVQYGKKVKSLKNKDNWNPPFKFSFGLEDEDAQNAWVEAVVETLKAPMEDRAEMKEWTRKFEWPRIANRWNEVMK